LVVGEEFLETFVTFGLVAGVASEREIAHAVAAAFAFGHNMLDFEGNVFLVTVDTLVSELDEKVFFDFEAD
jgi:hypothetical protein